MHLRFQYFDTDMKNMAELSLSEITYKVEV